MYVVRFTLSVLIVLTLLISSCEQSTGPTKSVDFYENNPEPRATMLKQCKELQADATKDANCVNASTAAIAAAQRAPIPKVNFNKVPVAK